MIGTRKKCAVCGEPLTFQGGKFICMNDKCPNYLVGAGSQKSSPLAKGLMDADL